MIKLLVQKQNFCKLVSHQKVLRDIACFLFLLIPIKQDYAVSTISDQPLNLVEQYSYLGSNISSTEIDVNVRIRKAWSVI